MIVSLVHTKGGVGKTTSAMFLALVAARGGRAVRLLDADPQGSASSWAERAAASSAGLPFPVLPASVEVVRAVSAGAGELVVIDTPPGTAAVIDAAIDVADLVVIPTGAAPADIDRVWPTLDITTHRPTTVLLTAVDLRTTLGGAVRDFLPREGVPVLNTVVRRRQAITSAFGTVPAHPYDYADAYDEIDAILSGQEGN